MLLSILHKRFKIVDGIYVDVDKILLATLILIGTYVFVKALRRLITRPNLISDKIQEKRQMTIFLLTKYAVWFIAILASLSVVGIDLGTLVIGSTALLVGLGLGLQHVFTDLVSGIFLLSEGSLKIGDVIEVDGNIGKVMDINLRSCELKTRDDVMIVLPNSKFLADRVVNWTHSVDQVRFTIEVGVAYGSDVDKVTECLINAAETHKDVATSPKPIVQFANFGESSLEFKLFFWSKEAFLIENVKSDIRREIYLGLKEQGMEIPFPQRDVHIKGVDGTDLLKQMDLKNRKEN
jgi:small-conductance mechanosensitive channel